jgi:hypothetical protein
LIGINIAKRLKRKKVSGIVGGGVSKKIAISYWLGIHHDP